MADNDDKTKGFKKHGTPVPVRHDGDRNPDAHAPPPKPDKDTSQLPTGG